MKKMLVAGVAATALLFSTAAQCSIGPASRPTHSHDLTPPAAGISSQGQQVVTLVNQQRAAAGCDNLVVDGSMTAFAQSHAEWMDNGGGLTHSTLGGKIQAENVAAGFTSAQSLVNAWMDSPTHRANILNCSFSLTGVGNAGTYWAQEFGNA